MAQRYGRLHQGKLRVAVHQGAKIVQRVGNIKRHVHGAHCSKRRRLNATRTKPYGSLAEHLTAPQKLAQIQAQGQHSAAVQHGGARQDQRYQTDALQIGA